MISKSLFCKILDEKIKPLTDIDDYLTEKAIFAGPFDEPAIVNLIDCLIQALGESLSMKYGVSHFAISAAIIQYLWGGEYATEDKDILIQAFNGYPKTAEEIYDYFISFHTNNN